MVKPPRLMNRDAFVKVKDASRRPVRGLYKRGPSFYARLAINKKNTWVRLQDSDSIEAAIEARRQIVKNGVVKRQDHPPFNEFVDRYLELIGKMKKPTTVKGEKTQLKGTLTPFFGNRRMDEITPAHVEEFRAKRLKDDVTPNTVNHNIVVLRNVFKKAKVLLSLRNNPFEGIVQLEFDRKPKVFLPLETIRAAAEWIRKNVRCPETISDAILFLACTGARWTEGMQIRWEDVDWISKQVCIGALGSKGRTFRYVPFHKDLEDLLLKMHARMDTDNPKGWLFPSYRTPESIDPWPLRDIREALKRAQKALKQSHWTPHDLRHHFASRCVMAGIDFKTIAEWLGHKDGGMLVATVYGHLAPGHGKVQAAKLDVCVKDDKQIAHGLGRLGNVEMPFNDGLNVRNPEVGPAPHVGNGQL